MPQMAPMWWTFLMLIFNLTFMLMMVTNYFNLKPKNMMVNKNMNLSMNWKW
uniref:ATP synthase F0 subunit 8 n=1 Tax=Onukigallia onukii TaxID=1792642 RepID=UPI003001E3E8|nr:ATP synthase F0 subunit 8 [Onukigallia onukii]